MGEYRSQTAGAVHGAFQLTSVKRGWCVVWLLIIRHALLICLKAFVSHFVELSEAFEHDYEVLHDGHVLSPHAWPIFVSAAKRTMHFSISGEDAPGHWSIVPVASWAHVIPHIRTGTNLPDSDQGAFQRTAIGPPERIFRSVALYR